MREDKPITRKLALEKLWKAWRHVHANAHRAATTLGVEEADCDAMIILVRAQLQLELEEDIEASRLIMLKGLELVLVGCSHGFNYEWQDQHGAVRCSGWHEGTEQEATSQAIKHLNAPAN